MLSGMVFRKLDMFGDRGAIMGIALSGTDYQHIASAGAVMLSSASMNDFMDVSMRQVKRLLPSQSLMFMVTSSLNWKWEDARTLGLDRDYPRLHHHHFRDDPGRPILIDRWKRRQPSVLNSTLLWPANGRPRSRFYRAFLEPRNIRHSLAISVPAGDNFFGTLVMFRPDLDGIFTPYDEAKAEALLPFLRGGLDRLCVGEKHRRVSWLLNEVRRDLPYDELAVVDENLDLICAVPERSDLLEDIVRDVQRPTNEASAITPDLRPVCRKLMMEEGERRVNLTVSFKTVRRWGLELTVSLRKKTYDATAVLSIHVCRTGEAAPTRMPLDGFHLTRQERRVAAEAAAGATNAEIAARLALSPSTVAHHLASALKKTGRRARWQLQSSPDLAQKISTLPLTRRQGQILEARLSGLSTAMTAVKLNIGEVTVRNHLRAIYRALGVSGFRGLTAHLKRL